MEVSRKHGPFDTRWPCIRKDSAGAVSTGSLGAAELAEALEWDAFSTRHFGERGRHDSEARSAYAAYRQGREWRNLGGSGLSLVPPLEPSAKELESEEEGGRRLLAAVAAIDRQEPHQPAVTEEGPWLNRNLMD